MVPRPRPAKCPLRLQPLIQPVFPRARLRSMADFSFFDIAPVQSPPVSWTAIHFHIASCGRSGLGARRGVVGRVVIVSVPPPDAAASSAVTIFRSHAAPKRWKALGRPLLTQSGRHGSKLTRGQGTVRVGHEALLVPGNVCNSIVVGHAPGYQPPERRREPRFAS
jgi:hypothetical protein